VKRINNQSISQLSNEISSLDIQAMFLERAKNAILATAVELMEQVEIGAPSVMQDKDLENEIPSKEFSVSHLIISELTPQASSLLNRSWFGLRHRNDRAQRFEVSGSLFKDRWGGCKSKRRFESLIL
jgi:hypothetical protein